MPASTTINDVAVVASAVLAELNGTTSEAQIDTDAYVHLAQLAKSEVQHAPILAALTQVISKTVFAVRSYTGAMSFKGLMRDSIQFGNHVRRIYFEDTPIEKDSRFGDPSAVSAHDWADGESYDMYRIHKAQPLELNFYGSDTWMKEVTIFRDQLKSAFTSESSFSAFTTNLMIEVQNQLEQVREGLARGTELNLIGATFKNGQTINLITEYNTLCGLTGDDALDINTIYLPANFKPFVQFCYARIKEVSDRMTKRTASDHINPYVSGSQKVIQRFTPKANQLFYMLSSFTGKMEAMGVADVFNVEKLGALNYEPVSFWQEPDTPALIKAKVSYFDQGDSTHDASVKSYAFDNSTVIGIIQDDEAAGITAVEQYVANSPMNTAGYYNIAFHEQFRWWNNNVEKAVVFCLA